MQKFYTPEQFILKNLGTYPTLFKASTYDQVKYRVLDHVLNTIGNGNSRKDYIYHDYDFESAKRFITTEQLYYAYRDQDVTVKTYGKVEIVTAKSFGKSIDILESEKSLYPEYVHYTKSNTTELHVPYTNFDYTYSSVYSKDFKFQTLGLEWIEAAIWFYQESLKFFNSENVSQYHYAFPQFDPKTNSFKTQNQIKDFNNHIAKYKSYYDISRDYGLEFTGDTADFLQRRWDKELSRIIEFINKTIEMLEKLAEQEKVNH